MNVKPSGTVVPKASAEDLARDGIDVNASVAQAIGSAPNATAHRAGAH